MEGTPREGGFGGVYFPYVSVTPIIKEHQQALMAPGNLHAVGKQHLGGRCRWCKQDGNVQEKK